VIVPEDTEETGIPPGPVHESSAGDVVLVAIDSLLPSDSPRVAGEDMDHILVLAQTDVRLPPILVHRSTMRVIDGMYRVRAAQRRGDTRIETRFFDGSDEEAFLLAVKLNNAQGLPLSQADRTTAAKRLINSHPQWSDRRIAKATGLATKTIAAARRRSTDAGPQLNTRVGRDGRVRPLNPAEGRRRACQVMADRPQATLREIAQQAGISLATARDVRERVRKGQDPVPQKLREAEARMIRPDAHAAPRGGRDKAAEHSSPAYFPHAQTLSALQSLRRDPSLRLTEAGRTLLHMLSVHALSAEEWERLMKGIPIHRRYVVAELARGCAANWSHLAQALEDYGQGPISFGGS
jgi:ParB-like chromosome segregation protein Spo0J